MEKDEPEKNFFYFILRKFWENPLEGLFFIVMAIFIILILIVLIPLIIIITIAEEIKKYKYGEQIISFMILILIILLIEIYKNL